MFIELNKKQIKDKIAYIHQFMTASNAATGSAVDANSNVTTKDIAVLESELYKDFTIQINRHMVMDKMLKLYGPTKGLVLKERFMNYLDNHFMYVHDETSLKPYCASVSLYPFLLEGTKNLGGTSTAPTNLRAFCGSFCNLVYQLASNFAGAIATVEFLMYFDHFARKEWGEGYLAKHAKEVAQELQGVVYTMNQPAAARGNQSVFWNISLFDEGYFNSLFGTFYFPDEDKPSYESLAALQAFFLEWFTEERTKSLLTFPVVTAAYLVDKNDRHILDDTFADLLAKSMSEGLSFFHYESDSADSLSSCCFDANQRVLVRNEDGVKLIRIGDFKPMRNLTIFFDGSWVEGSFVKTSPTNKMYRIITANKKEVFCTANHIFPTMEGDKRADEISTDDWLMFNDRAYKEGSGDYKDGFLIGMYLGDGSIYEQKDCDSVQVTLSLNEDKVKNCIEYISNWHIHPSKNNVVSAFTSDKNVAKFIRYWVKGTKCNNKELNMNVCNKSLDFRRGILDGFYATDGGNSNRIYTTSKRLAEQMEAMLTTMGIQTVLNVSDRTNEKVIIRGEVFKRNFPLYCIRWYDMQNKRSMGDIYKRTLNGTFFKVTEVQEITNYDESVYCFNMADGKEPYFTLANGIQTHNCRLRNALADNTFSYTLGAGGVSTGSFQVITMNINRVFHTDNPKGLFENMLEDIPYFLNAYRELIKDYINAGMLPAYSALYIHLDKQFGTIGINGMLEAYETLYGNPKDDIEAYKKSIAEVMEAFKTNNIKAREHFGYRFNTEFVPAENLGVKNSKWDKENEVPSPRDCYNSYFFPVEDADWTILDKLDVHGKEVAQYLDGGAACHLNLESIPTQKACRQLMNLAAKKGVPYWTTNVLTTICKACGRIDPFTRDTCKYCGSDNVEYATRVIGYLKPISSFSKDRQHEAGLRYYNPKKANN